VPPYIFGGKPDARLELFAIAVSNGARRIGGLLDKIAHK
jgi:hypothetical protein